MKTEMEAARDAALVNYRNDYRINDEDGDHFEHGFDAGWNARGSQWVAVKSEDDLPSLSGDYLVTYEYKGIRFVREMEYNAVNVGTDYRWYSPDLSINEALAWMPLPEPYTADSGQEGE